MCLLALSGCVKTIHDDIPSTQIALKSSQREQQAEAYFLQGQQAQSNGNTAEALAAYALICKNYLETDVAPRAFHQSGKIFQATGRLEQAFNQLKFITKNYVDYADYDAVLQNEFQIACTLMERYKNKKGWTWLTFFKDPTPAIACFQHIVDSSPRSDSAPRALFYIAQLQFENNEKVKAVEALDRIIEKYPLSPWTPDAYLLQGKIYLSFVNSEQNDQGMTQKAIHCYEDFLLLFGASELKDKVEEAKRELAAAQVLYAKSRLVLGDFYLYRRSYPEGAIVFYNEARMLAPTSEVAQQADERIDFSNSKTFAPMTWADRCFGRVVHKPTR